MSFEFSQGNWYAAKFCNYQGLQLSSKKDITQNNLPSSLLLILPSSLQFSHVTMVSAALEAMLKAQSQQPLRLHGNKRDTRRHGKGCEGGLCARNILGAARRDIAAARITNQRITNIEISSNARSRNCHWSHQVSRILTKNAPQFPFIRRAGRTSRCINEHLGLPNKGCVKWGTEEDKNVPGSFFGDMLGRYWRWCTSAAIAAKSRHWKTN